MSGLLALLDDIAGIAKIAAASVDDIAANAMKAGAKAAGAVIDDAAVTPKYTMGFAAERELPIVARIAKGSIFNKMVILLPAGLALDAFAPWAIPWLLILGGAFLCYEGAEKVLHVFQSDHGHTHPGHDHPEEKTVGDAHLEETKVKGAVKTDFILSAEIMTIALAEISDLAFPMKAVTLAVVAIGITIVVYGSVAIIVKADDVGLKMASDGRVGIVRSAGRAIVRGMPYFMKLLLVVGTAAMLWVGGSIVLHNLEITHFWAWPYETIHHIAEGIAHGMETAKGFVAWFVTAFLDGIAGLLLGLILVPIVTKILGLFGKDSSSSAHH